MIMIICDHDKKCRQTAHLFLKTVRQKYLLIKRKTGQGKSLSSWKVSVIVYNFPVQ